MNKAMAVSGTSVCTIFTGDLLSVDRGLIQLGRSASIESERDQHAPRFKKESNDEGSAIRALCGQIADLITLA